ncbi:MAG: GNAT family N-acetyltransferase [Asgard group archaeon]|nr:GNAT family N-acetyltransferase [Asgard group archaeon]
MNIRKATKDDIEEIIEVWQESGLPIRPHGRDDPSNLNKQLEQPNLWILIAEEDNNLVGVVLVSHDSRKGWINRLAVRPKSARQGIATKLLQEAEKSLIQAGIEVFACLISDDNIASRTFFEKNNYVYHNDITYYSKRFSEES